MRGGATQKMTPPAVPENPGGGDPGNHAIPADFSDAIPGKHQRLPRDLPGILEDDMHIPGAFLEWRPQNHKEPY